MPKGKGGGKTGYGKTKPATAATPKKKAAPKKTKKSY